MMDTPNPQGWLLRWQSVRPCRWARLSNWLTIITNSYRHRSLSLPFKLVERNIFGLSLSGSGVKAAWGRRAVIVWFGKICIDRQQTCHFISRWIHGNQSLSKTSKKHLCYYYNGCLWLGWILIDTRLFCGSSGPPWIWRLTCTETKTSEIPLEKVVQSYATTS